jgi:hypothetical protein
MGLELPWRRGGAANSLYLAIYNDPDEALEAAGLSK